jgi:hypothetical protein
MSSEGIPMRASFVVSAVMGIGFLSAAPFAAAFTVQNSSSVPAADAPRVADPDDVRQNLQNQPLTGNSTTFGTQVGNTRLRFGVTQPYDSAPNGNNWFLESPAVRTVPSQRR